MDLQSTMRPRTLQVFATRRVVVGCSFSVGLLLQWFLLVPILTILVGWWAAAAEESAFLFFSQSHTCLSGMSACV